MRQTVVFLFSILITIILLYWINGYYALTAEKRGSFLDYVQNDINQKIGQTKTGLEQLPDLFLALNKGQKDMEKVLIAQIQRALEVYYLSFEQYPDKLEKIINLDALPKDMRLEYRRRGDGYILRLINKEGKILQEITI